MTRPASLKTPVLLLGQKRDVRSAARALEDAGIATRVCCSVAAACAKEDLEEPQAIVMCAGTLTRQSAEELAELGRHFPAAALIALAPAVERWEIRAAVAAGASGVLLDDEDLPRSLPACIASALAGQVCVPRAHGRQIAPPALSTREKQILGLVVMGYMNCQIAERLYLAESTVKSHLSSAFGKLGVRSRNEAASLILDSERGLGTGILALTAEPLVPTASHLA